MLLLSACQVDDPEQDKKIEAVASGLDRMFTLLQLQGAYDSNEFAGRLYEVGVDLRQCAAVDIPAIFEKHLVAELAERRGVRDQGIVQLRPISPDVHRQAQYPVHALPVRARGRDSGEGHAAKLRHTLRELVTLRGRVNGFHVEHILSRNADNLALFGGDEERFDQERNRLGGILLLKGRDNISSGNESFDDKLKSYASTLLWNETLRKDTYKSKLDFKAFIAQHGLSFRWLSSFGPEEVEERHKLLFAVCSLIWPSPARGFGMSLHQEIRFEEEICEHLAANGWLYAEGDAAGYNRARALFQADVLAWVQETQPKAWETLTKNHGAGAGATLLARLRAQLDQLGTLEVLRRGIELLGLKQPLKLAEFKPSLGINPDILARYTANRLRVVRQVRYSPAQREQPGPGAVPERPAGGDGRAQERLHAEHPRRRRPVPLRSATRSPKGQAPEPLLCVSERRAGALRRERRRGARW